MKIPNEDSAAEHLAMAVNSRSFLPRVFGFAAVAQNTCLHTPMMAAVIGLIDVFADRHGKWVDADANRAYRVAYDLRESLRAEYGMWPPDLNG